MADVPRARSGTVTSINVGAPREVHWAGRTVLTAIWKSPVAGPVAVRDANFVGDAQADLRVHGGPDKAVYAYSAEDHCWWEGELGCDLEPGAFGENMTTVGIDLSVSVVGEVWAVGSALLAVTQPRLPCFKLGVRMGDAAFVDRFQEAGRYGVYLRVQHVGDIAAGDTITLVSTPAHGLTATMIADIYHAPAVDDLRRLVGIDDVPNVWRTWADRQIRRAEHRDG